MSYSKLQDLMAQRAQVEAQIRQARVVAIRQCLAIHKSPSKTLLELVGKMENTLAMVHYNHELFSDLLDEIEERI